MRLFIKFITLFTLVLCLFSSCSKDIDKIDNISAGKMKITVTLGGNAPSTKALPPGNQGGMLPGETRVDRVWLIVFRRAAGSADDFVYYNEDNNNGNNNGNKIILSSYIAETEGDGNQLRLFEATIDAKSDKEYKIVALGYSSRDDGSNATQDGLFLSGRYEENMFTVPLTDGETTLSGLEFMLKQIQEEPALKRLGTADLDMPYGTKGINSPSYDVTPFYVFKVNLEDGGIWDNSEPGTGAVAPSTNDFLSQVCAPAPELYYAICTNRDGNEILSATDTGITGVLYRGMAKVQVEVPVDGNDVKWIALLANNVNTVSGLSSYDDFHDANTPVEPRDPSPGFEQYTLLSVAQPVEGKVMLQAYVLPTVTNLAAIAYGDFDSDNKMEHSFFFINTEAYTEGDNATGVITVITDGDKFNFKRNKFYKITYNSFDDLVY